MQCDLFTRTRNNLVNCVCRENQSFIHLTTSLNFFWISNKNLIFFLFNYQGLFPIIAFLRYIPLIRLLVDNFQWTFCLFMGSRNFLLKNISEEMEGCFNREEYTVELRGSVLLYNYVYFSTSYLLIIQGQKAAKVPFST